jgi:hypothetical protein
MSALAAASLATANAALRGNYFDVAAARFLRSTAAMSIGVQNSYDRVQVILARVVSLARGAARREWAQRGRGQDAGVI